MVKNLQCRDPGSILGWEDPLEKGMATRSSILAWEIPLMEETGRLQSMVTKSQIRLSDKHFHFHIHTHTHTYTHIYMHMYTNIYI